MARRRRDRTWDNVELIVRLGLGLLFLAALGIGGVAGFGKALSELLSLILVAVFAVAATGLVFLVARSFFRAWRESRASLPSAAYGGEVPASTPLEPMCPARSRPPGEYAAAAPRPVMWTASTVEAALGEIDWYQFEKFCAALLHADGFTVTRKGGAQPDGGVDLIVEQSGSRALIQCKHWRTWVVQERTVREMLGSMTHFGVKQAAIYTLKGWTTPAEKFAASHAITLVDGKHLAASAVAQLSASQLNSLLQPGVHHCPKCEAPMVQRTGAFGTFWGCSSFPRCRGKMKHAGAR